MMENLEGITTNIISDDHILNLLPDMSGQMPQDKEKMIKVLIDFLEMDPYRQMLYRLGRRAGWLHRIEALDDPLMFERIDSMAVSNNVTPENIDLITDDIIKNYI